MKVYIRQNPTVNWPVCGHDAEKKDYPKVEFVKAARHLFGLGLKDAKDLIEDVIDGGREVVIDANVDGHLRSSIPFREFSQHFVVKFEIDLQENLFRNSVYNAVLMGIETKQWDSVHDLVRILERIG